MITFYTASLSSSNLVLAALHDAGLSSQEERFSGKILGCWSFERATYREQHKTVCVNHQDSEGQMRNFGYCHKEKNYFVFIFFAGLLSLLVSGNFYRQHSRVIGLASQKKIELDKPLGTFPVLVGGWSGENVAIPENIQRIAGNDDYLNRLYVNKKAGVQWANVYVAYCGRPRNMIGHNPQACYAGNGWIWDESVESSFLTLGGREVKCVIHRFHRPSEEGERVVVLNYYILNGKLTCDEKGFSGVEWRSPNIEGNPAHYVAQVQISSSLENSARNLASEVTELMLSYFPAEK